MYPLIVLAILVGLSLVLKFICKLSSVRVVGMFVVGLFVTFIMAALIFCNGIVGPETSSTARASLLIAAALYAGVVLIIMGFRLYNSSLMQTSSDGYGPTTTTSSAGHGYSQIQPNKRRNWLRRY